MKFPRLPIGLVMLALVAGCSPRPVPESAATTAATPTTVEASADAAAAEPAFAPAPPPPTMPVDAAPVAPAVDAVPDAEAAPAAPVIPAKDALACATDADCTVKDVGSCCGYSPRCVNKDARTFPEQVKAKCASEGRVGTCGFREITGCQCVEGKCAADGAPDDGLRVH